MKDTLLYKIIRFLFSSWFKIRYNPKIEGMDNIPDSGPVIIVANHFSNLDFISMGLTTKRQVHFLAKNTLFKGPLKIILNGVGAISVNRTVKDKSVTKNSKEVLKKNLVLGLFPEGTFNKTDDVVAPFKIGAVKFASDTNTPIIPVAITGKYKRNRLKIIIGKQFVVKTKNLDIENDRLRELMRKMLIKNGEV